MPPAIEEQKQQETFVLAIESVEDGFSSSTKILWEAYVNNPVVVECPC